MRFPTLNEFIFWLRRTLGLPISWHCTRSLPCTHKREYDTPTWSTDEPLVIDHAGVHVFCSHCTNPLIQCRKCGNHYIDRNEPNPERWVYRGLWRGWEHRGMCWRSSGN